MTAPSAASQSPAGPVDARADRSVGVATRVCPYLIAADGSWRSAVPQRDQQCSALTPPSPLAPDKQRRLCVTDGHVRCATFLAARDLEAAVAAPRSPVSGETGVTRWTLTRTAPVLLDSGRFAAVAGIARQRAGGQLFLGGLMAVALAAVVLARLPVDGTGGGDRAALVGALASSTPSVAQGPTQAPPTPRVTLPNTPASAGPTPVVETPAPTTEPTGTPAQTPDATPQVTPTPPPARSYTVKSGDTLYGIAIEFDTSVKAIMDINDLSSSAIQPGLELRLP